MYACSEVTFVRQSNSLSTALAQWRWWRVSAYDSLFYNMYPLDWVTFQHILPRLQLWRLWRPWSPWRVSWQLRCYFFCRKSSSYQLFSDQSACKRHRPHLIRFLCCQLFRLHVPLALSLTDLICRDEGHEEVNALSILFWTLTLLFKSAETCICA